MHPRLQTLRDELVEAQQRLDRLASSIPEALWSRRPEPGRWSPAECVVHLNLTSRAYLPLLESALEEARRAPAGPPRRYRRDPVGWLLWKSLGPPVRIRTKTSAQFVPGSTHSPAEIIDDFGRLQQEQIEYVEQADGLPLGSVRVASPFDPRIRYNLYSCLSILPRHQHRHLWQAEKAVQALRESP